MDAPLGYGQNLKALEVSLKLMDEGIEELDMDKILEGGVSASLVGVYIFDISLFFSRSPSSRERQQLRKVL